MVATACPAGCCVMSRYLNVMGHDLPISDDVAAALMNLCLANECGDPAHNHDLHLTDEGDDPNFTEKLVLTLAGKAVPE